MKGISLAEPSVEMEEMSSLEALETSLKLNHIAAFLDQRSNIFTTVREDIPNVRSNDIQTPAFSSRPAQTLDLKVDAHIEELLREYLYPQRSRLSSNSKDTHSETNTDKIR
jgi:hypothetical protein